MYSTGPVEAWRVMMSLKSGLLSETTWALDTLNILLYDDHTVSYFMLAHLPGLLDNLIDHFRRYLNEIFDNFAENEISVGKMRVKDLDKTVCVRETYDAWRKTGEFEPTDVSNSLTAVIASCTMESQEGFSSSSSDWLMGGGDTTLHIQTHMAATKECPTELRNKRTHSSCPEVKCEKNVKGENEGLPLKDEPELLEQSKTVVKESNSHEECKEVGSPASSVSNCSSPDSDLDSKQSFVNLKKVKLDAKPKLENAKCTVGNFSSALGRETDEEEFTRRLKKELDLDVDSVLESDIDIMALLDSKESCKLKHQSEPIEEEQSSKKEDAPLCLRSDWQNTVSRRCVCVSNILRGLSFVPGNDGEMARHAGLLMILGRLFLLHHRHVKRVPYRHSYLQDERDCECPSDDTQDWWWECLEALRENALVMIANVAGQLDLSFYPELISFPILDGLLHWCVCQSAAALDTMPTATPGTSLSAQQLVLETLAKMSILEGNVDLILATPPTERLDELYSILVRMLAERQNPVTRELALVLLSNLAQGESTFVCVGDKRPCISTLMEFIEDAETSMNAYMSGGSSLAQAGYHTEDFCGTSVDMLRRAASTLVCFARIQVNRPLFLPFQERLLSLATSQVLDSAVVGSLAEVMFYLSR